VSVVVELFYVFKTMKYASFLVTNMIVLQKIIYWKYLLRSPLPQYIRNVLWRSQYRPTRHFLKSESL
jgi:hypothetical protein